MTEGRAQASRNQASEDARVLRTRAALERALLELAEEHHFAEISASEIARRAGVNRNTLYLHYRDKDDLLMQTLDHLFVELTEQSRRSTEEPSAISPFEPPRSWLEFMRTLGERRVLFRRLLSEQGSFALAARLRAFHVEYFEQAWEHHGLRATPGSPSLDFRANFSASSSIGMVHWWLENDEDIPADVMTAWLWRHLHSLWFWDAARVQDLPEIDATP